MQRTKNHGLLHKNFVKETNACRQGMADYLITFRKWGLEGQVPVTQNRVIGEYIGKIFIEIKQRPIYLVKEIL
jgi:hypothetical protein